MKNVAINKGKRSCSGLDANAVNKELIRIKKMNGGLLHPRRVWEASKAKSALLHGEFTWDDGEAADQWRDKEARDIISAVIIDGKNPVTRAWAHVVVKDESGYVPTEHAVRDRGLREQVISEIRRGLVQQQNRLSAFQEFVSEVRKLGEVINKLAS